MMENPKISEPGDSPSPRDAFDPLDEFDPSDPVDASETLAFDSALDVAPGHASSEVGVKAPHRNALDLLSKIPVQLTLEVGTATLSLAALMAVNRGTVLALDHIAGEPLRIKVNGTDIGRGEVVLSGKNYALRVVDLDDLTGLDRTTA